MERNEYDAKDAARLRDITQGCVGRIGPRTGNEEILGWTIDLLKEGPVRFGRLVFEVNDTQGRYYAGTGEKSRGSSTEMVSEGDTLWDTLRCVQTVSVISADGEGIDLRTFANAAIRSWMSDWGDNPPSEIKYPKGEE